MKTSLEPTFGVDCQYDKNDWFLSKECKCIKFVEQICQETDLGIICDTEQKECIELRRQMLKGRGERMGWQNYLQRSLPS